MIDDEYKPINLKTEMLSEAYGISTKNPAFSWVINSSIVDDIQTFYRILVSKTFELKGDFHDTDWIESNSSSFVHIPELESKLEDNQLYYWQVQIKNKEGIESPLSSPCPFVTDVSTEWRSLNGIWAVPSSSWKDYSFEAAISIQTGNALGILIRIDNDKNGYLIQFRDADNLIRCHTIEKGTVNVNPFQELKLFEYNISLPTDKSEFKVNFTVSKKKPK